MRSKANPKTHGLTTQRSRGFTLVELLITVGIIALLFGISLVAISHSRLAAQKTRVRSDLGMIVLALDAYKDEFHDYPRFPDAGTDQATANNPGNGIWLDYSTDRGARLLCQALMSPGPAGNGLIANPGEDGADGPGFKVRRSIAGGGNTGIISGKTYGPYLAADKFKLETNKLNMQDAKILDIFGNPILYFPALQGPLNISPPTGSFVVSVDPSSASATSPKPLYNAFDNSMDTTTNKPMLDPLQMQFLLGDISFDGTINGSESAVTTQAYLLWTAGPDGQYGFGIDPATQLPRTPGGNSSSPFGGQKTDDIANFDFPAGFRK